MSYLIPYDYERLIQDVNVQQIISGNSRLRTFAENTAIEEMKSYLRKKFEVATEFTDTQVYSPTAEYKASNRVYLFAPFYNEALATYNLNAVVTYKGNVYKNIVAISVAEVFTEAKWQKLGALYDMFYAVYPKPLFDLNATYKKDDQVFWKDKVYVCQIDSIVLSHEGAIQYPSTTMFPANNVFPDDPTQGEKYWGAGTAYAVAPNKLLDTTFFLPGDNRNQQLVLYLLDMIIYHLYRRIPPAVVPELRILAYQDAKSWLSKVAKGDDVSPDIVKVQPKAGSHITFGSRPKQENYY
jgi:hypothetical protein